MRCVFQLFTVTLYLFHPSLRGLIFAATDTTSSALAQTLQLLSEYPEVQEKLRQEVIQASGGDIEVDIPYDELVDLPYLDAVSRETLRL